MAVPVPKKESFQSDDLIQQIRNCAEYNRIPSSRRPHSHVQSYATLHCLTSQSASKKKKKKRETFKAPGKLNWNGQPAGPPVTGPSAFRSADRLGGGSNQQKKRKRKTLEATDVRIAGASATVSQVRGESRYSLARRDVPPPASSEAPGHAPDRRARKT